ncbi:hypothetical protein SAMN05518847_101869 [Paenibacillus sp. OV219]|nr:hypothetical protein SAMN05518847_101869 [Paenibacillus sp. OV219]
MIFALDIFCAHCKQVKTAIRHESEKQKYIMQPSNVYPISICSDCEEELLSRLQNFLKKSIDKEIN